MDRLVRAHLAANAGVLRCIVQMGAADTAMRNIWYERNQRVVDRAMVGWEKHNPSKDPALQRWVMRTAGGMLDQSLLSVTGSSPVQGSRSRRTSTSWSISTPC